MKKSNLNTNFKNQLKNLVAKLKNLTEKTQNIEILKLEYEMSYKDDLINKLQDKLKITKISENFKEEVRCKEHT